MCHDDDTLGVELGDGDGCGVGEGLLLLGLGLGGGVAGGVGRGAAVVDDRAGEGAAGEAAAGEAAGRIAADAVPDGVPAGDADTLWLEALSADGLGPPGWTVTTSVD